MSDFNIQTNRVTEGRWPDSVVINKENRKWRIIDFTVPNEKRYRENKKVPGPIYWNRNVIESAD